MKHGCERGNGIQLMCDRAYVRLHVDLQFVCQAPSAKCPLGPGASIKTDISQYRKRRPIERHLWRRNSTTLWGLVQRSGCTDKSSQHEGKNPKSTRDTEMGLIMIPLFWRIPHTFSQVRRIKEPGTVFLTRASDLFFFFSRDVNYVYYCVDWKEYIHIFWMIYTFIINTHTHTCIYKSKKNIYTYLNCLCFTRLFLVS